MSDCGAKMQHTKQSDTAPLPRDKTRHIQYIVRKFLFLERARDNTVFYVLNDLTCTATNNTEATLTAAATYYLNYIASNYVTSQIEGK